MTASTPGAIGEDQARQELSENLMVFVQRMRVFYREQATRIGLSMLQARVLYLLDEEPSSARELADRLDLDPSNITSIVDRLELADLLRREVQAGDRRVKLLVVSDAGRAVAASLRAATAGDNPVVHALDGRQQRQLSELLGLVLKDLSAR